MTLSPSRRRSLHSFKFGRIGRSNSGTFSFSFSISFGGSSGHGFEQGLLQGLHGQEVHGLHGVQHGGGRLKNTTHE